jgi:hypothetical protein
MIYPSTHYSRPSPRIRCTDDSKYDGSAFMIPGLALGKLYGNSILVLLNNRFTIPGEGNAFHPEFEIPESYRRSTLEP